MVRKVIDNYKFVNSLHSEYTYNYNNSAVDQRSVQVEHFNSYWQKGTLKYRCIGLAIASYN